MSSMLSPCDPCCEPVSAQRGPCRDLGLSYSYGSIAAGDCRPFRRSCEAEYREPIIVLRDEPRCRPARGCAVDCPQTSQYLGTYARWDADATYSIPSMNQGQYHNHAYDNERMRDMLPDMSNTHYSRFDAPQHTQSRFNESEALRNQELLDLMNKQQTGSQQMNARSKTGASLDAKTSKSQRASKSGALSGTLASGAKTSKAVGKGVTKRAGKEGTAADVRPIRILVKEAAGLVAPATGRPLVQLELHGAKKETTSHDPSPNPVWNQQLVLPEKAGAGKRRLTVVVKTQIGEVGRSTMELPSYALHTDVWVPVSRADKVTGNVHLSIDAPDGDESPSAAPAARAHAAYRPPRAPRKSSVERPRPASPPPDVEYPDESMGIPSQPMTWDLIKMDGEKFWVCLVAKDGHLVLDPAEYKKAPAMWTMSQASTEAVFNAYNSSFQTSMRRRGLNKLNSYWQKEINDMKGIYMSHLDEGSILKAKEEQILKLERDLAEAEASRDDLAGKLVESQALLTEKAHQMKDLNEEMNTELTAMLEGRRQWEERRAIEDQNLSQMMQENRDWAWRTQARMFEMEHEGLEGLTAEELVAEVNALRDELQRQQFANQQMSDRLQMLSDSAAVRDAVSSDRPDEEITPLKKRLY